MNRPIRRPSTYYGMGSLARDPGAGRDVSYETFVKTNAVRAGVPVGYIAAPDQIDPDAPPAVARVYNGDWIADCPEPDELCRDAVIVDPAWPVFCCTRCGNVSLGGKWRRLIVPAPEALQTIEALLAARPFDPTRNWFPRESIADLTRENQQKGLDPDNPPEPEPGPPDPGPRLTVRRL